MKKTRGNLRCVIMAVDGSQESMNALRWVLDNIKLRSHTVESPDDGAFIVLHVQSPSSITTGLSPGAIPFSGPIDSKVLAFTAAIEAHKRWITEAILDHASWISFEYNVNVE
ncbi:hypothetical protein CIPAW_06G032200 [Carya illinoinensis]|uniref:UspA domain-containing protein n=1 Tax=Carya illinoinensis TaxID=32201 RepID=A0A8T1Q789_CARIL|nr:hypothetical protein CIPAW_06G032200 [Carya illinoinensis]